MTLLDYTKWSLHGMKRIQRRRDEEGRRFLETNNGFKNIRTWQPERGEWKLTRLGKRYYRANPSNFIISLPVRYDLVRARDGSEIFYKGYVPVSSLPGPLRDLMGQIEAEGSPEDVITPLRQGV